MNDECGKCPVCVRPHSFQVWNTLSLMEKHLLKEKTLFVKVRFKHVGTKFWNRCHYSTMYQIFLIQIALKSSDWAELDFLCFVIRIFFERQIPKCETLILAITNMHAFSVLLCWVWRKKDGDLKRNIYIQSNSFSRKLKIDTKCYHLLAMTLYPTQ